MFNDQFASGLTTEEKMKKIILVSSLILTLVGCVEVKDQEDPKSPEVTAQVSGLSYEIEPLAQPQAYMVRFSGVNCDQKLLKTSRSKSNQYVQLSQCSEIVSEAGLHVYYFTEGALQIDIPQDVVIKGQIYLNQLNPEPIELKTLYNLNLKINGRLYFESGSTLFTNGESVLIQADMVISDGGRIITHNTVDVPYAQNGKHGGHIHLKTNKIQGALEVILQGQNGGHGEPGTIFTGKKIEQLIISGGNGGNSGKFWLEAKDDSMSQIKIIKIPGLKGVGSEIRGGCPFGSDSNCHPRILRPKGDDGQHGLEEKSCLIINNECTNFILN